MEIILFSQQIKISMIYANLFEPQIKLKLLNQVYFSLINQVKKVGKLVYPYLI